MKILIVEDDFVSRKLLTYILNKYGICHVAVNGKEAVEAFEQANHENEPYDLICLDIMMPEMDGYEVLHRIRTFEESRNLWGSDGVKIIMTTAKSMPQDIISAFNAGCEAYVVKPIQKDELISEIKKLGLLQDELQNK